MSGGRPVQGWVTSPVTSRPRSASTAALRYRSWTKVRPPSEDIVCVLAVITTVVHFPAESYCTSGLATLTIEPVRPV